MALFNWNQSYSVEIDKFDNHHKKIIDLINNLHESMMQGKGKELLGGILNELKDYTQYHFREEELDMAKYGYLEYFDHKQKHKDLIKQLDELIEKNKTGSKEITIETFNFIKKWLTDHIKGVDKRYSSFFIKRGLK
ncbi:MAG: bacteriohemerythrin [Bacteroidales bacterium]